MTGTPGTAAAPTVPVAEPDRRSRPAWYRRPVTLTFLLVLTLLTCLLGYAEKAACRDTRNWSDDFQYRALCYSDVVALYGAEKLDVGARPFLDYPVEYPVLIGAAMSAAAEVSYLVPELSDDGQDLRVAAFGDATAVLLTLAAGVVVGCTALAAGRRRSDALLVALAPSLVLHAFTNWDLLAVAFATAALWAWGRRAPRLAGVLLGLGAATKLYPILFLVPLGLLCLRAGRLRAWWRTAVPAVGVLALVNLPVYLAAGYFTEDEQRGPGVLDVWRDGDGLGAALAPHHTVPGTGEVARNGLLRFLDLNSERVADWDSLAFGWQYLSSAFSPDAFAPLHLATVGAGALLLGVVLLAIRGRRRPTAVVGAVGLLLLVLVAVLTPGAAAWTREQQTLPVGGLNLVTGVAFLAALAGIALLCLRAPRRPRVAQVVFLTVVAFLLTNKVFSPQYVLWMLPLVALALPRWRPFLVWQVSEAVVLVTRYYYFAGVDEDGGLGLGWFVGAVVLRDLALLVLAGFVVRDVLRPAGDEVRATEPDGEDPLAGPLRGAADVVVLPRGRRTPTAPGPGQDEGDEDRRASGAGGPGDPPSESTPERAVDVRT